jgi:hypothetical protein
MAEAQKFTVQTATVRAADERNKNVTTCGERQWLENNWPHKNPKHILK